MKKHFRQRHPPIDGKDGYIKYYFDLEKLTPKVLNDGTVDYRNLLLSIM